jgi:UDP-glucose 4-epimerase
VVNAWDRIRNGQAPIIDGDGTNVTDFIYIGDAGRANLQAMVSAANGAYNITSGVDTTFNELIGAILEACGSDLKPEYKVDEAKVANPVVTRLGVSVAKAKADLGWEPQVDVKEGMRRLVKWLDDERARGRI